MKKILLFGITLLISLPTVASRSIESTRYRSGSRLLSEKLYKVGSCVTPVYIGEEEHWKESFPITKHIKMQIWKESKDGIVDGTLKTINLIETKEIWQFLPSSYFHPYLGGSEHQALADCEIMRTQYLDHIGVEKKLFKDSSSITKVSTKLPIEKKDLSSINIRFGEDFISERLVNVGKCSVFQDSSHETFTLLFSTSYLIEKKMWIEDDKGIIEKSIVIEKIIKTDNERNIVSWSKAPSMNAAILMCNDIRATFVDLLDSTNEILGEL